jgi:hypothetical protein
MEEARKTEQPIKKAKLDPKDFMFSNLKGQVLADAPCTMPG